MKKTILGLAFVAGTAMLVASCGSSKKTLRNVNLGGEWNVVAIEGQLVNSEQDPFIGYDPANGNLYGNAGCNRMMGRVVLDSKKPGIIHFENLGTTRMMCTDMQTEVKLMAAMNKVERYISSDSGIDLTDSDGQVLVSLTKRSPGAAALATLSGEWNVVTVGGLQLPVQDRKPFIGFDAVQKRIYGNVGCNSINGGIIQEDNNPSGISFSQMMSTMMACPGMDTERKVLKALGDTKKFETLTDGTLVLLDQNGKQVMTLTRK